MLYSDSKLKHAVYEAVKVLGNNLPSKSLAIINNLISFTKFDKLIKSLFVAAINLSICLVFIREDKNTKIEVIILAMKNSPSK